MNNLSNIVGEQGIKLNVQLSTEQMIMLAVFIFFGFFAAFLLGTLLINLITK